MPHAYFIAGDLEEGIQKAHAFLLETYGLEPANNPNLITLRHGLFSVDDARKVRGLADFATTSGTQKAIVLSAARLFHEAQNALLKLFEEPPEGTILFLILPSEGMLLPTLRSRLAMLPAAQRSEKKTSNTKSEAGGIAQEFMKANETGREKIIEKILDRAKSDNDDEKQAARLEAIQLVEGLTEFVYSEWTKTEGTKKSSRLGTNAANSGSVDLLSDLQSFLPILHERSAPLKLIFEHLLLVMP